MDDELRELERVAAQDPSAEGRLLSALVRSGQLQGERLRAAGLLYHRGARAALGWPAEAPVDRTLVSPDGAKHVLHRRYEGVVPLCGAAMPAGEAITDVVTCAACLRGLTRKERGSDELPVVSKHFAHALVELPAELLVASRLAWLADRLSIESGALSGWDHDLEAVRAWLVEPSPGNLERVQERLDAIGEEDDRLMCVELAVHGSRMNEGLVEDSLLAAEGLVGPASLRQGLARVGAWVLGWGPDPVTEPIWVTPQP